MPKQNRVVHLLNYPEGLPNPETDFAVVTTDLADEISEV
jgi:hypothetical protein